MRYGARITAGTVDASEGLPILLSGGCFLKFQLQFVFPLRVVEASARLVDFVANLKNASTSGLIN